MVRRSNSEPIFLVFHFERKQCGSGEREESTWCGVGEREGRVYSSLVVQIHFGLSHGMGHCEDIAEPQPTRETLGL
jgi:hypothetical protein